MFLESYGLSGIILNSNGNLVVLKLFFGRSMKPAMLCHKRDMDDHRLFARKKSLKRCKKWCAKPVQFVPDCLSWLRIISCTASMFSSVRTVSGRPYPSCGSISLVSSIFQKKVWTPASFHSNSGWSLPIHMPLRPCFCRSYLLTIFFRTWTPYCTSVV